MDKLIAFDRKVDTTLSKTGLKLMTGVRSLVSRDKFRFKDEALMLDLDLTYITDRIIAMGIPATKVEATWRNDVLDVARFFTHYHPDHFMIFNVSERSYDYSKFNNRVVCLGFPDHHPPPLSILCSLVQQMDAFLCADPQNVVAVHCLAGRGRTGTLIACLLMALARRQALVEAAGGGMLPGSLIGHGPLPQGRFPAKPFPALEYFAERRSSTKEGVAVPSQLRFARYYHALLYATDSLELPMPPVRRRLVLNRIEGSPVPMFALSEGFVPVFELLDLERYYASPLHITAATRKYTRLDGIFRININVEIEGDILVRLYNDVGIGVRTLLARCLFHTAFIGSEGTKAGNPLTFEVHKFQLDNPQNGSLSDSSFPEDFSLLLTFSEPGTRYDPVFRGTPPRSDSEPALATPSYSMQYAASASPMPPVPGLVLPTSQPLLGSYNSPHSAPTTPATNLYSPNGPPPPRPPGRPSSARPYPTGDSYFSTSTSSSSSSTRPSTTYVTPAVPEAYYGSPLLSPSTPPPGVSRFAQTSSGTQPAPIDAATVYVKQPPDPWSAWRSPSGSRSGSISSSESIGSYGSNSDPAASSTGSSYYSPSPLPSSSLLSPTATPGSAGTTPRTTAPNAIPPHVQYHPSASAASEEDLRRRLLNL